MDFCPQARSGAMLCSQRSFENLLEILQKVDKALYDILIEYLHNIFATVVGWGPTACCQCCGFAGWRVQGIQEDPTQQLGKHLLQYFRASTTSTRTGKVREAYGEQISLQISISRCLADRDPDCSCCCYGHPFWEGKD